MDNITNFTFFLAIVSTILFTFGITAFLTVFFMEKKGRFENPERLQKLRGVVSKLMLGFIPFLILTLILLIIGFQDVDSIDNSMSIFKDFFDSFGILPLDTLSALFGLDGDYLIVSVCFVFSLYLLLVLAYFLFHCFLVHSIIRKFPEVSVLLITKDKLRSFKDDIDSNPDIVYFIESEEKIERGGNALSIFVNGGHFWNHLLCRSRIRYFLHRTNGKIFFYDLLSDAQKKNKVCQDSLAAFDALSSYAKNICKKLPGGEERIQYRMLKDILFDAYYDEMRLREILPQSKLHLLKFKSDVPNLLANFREDYIEKEVSRICDNQTLEIYDNTLSLIEAFQKNVFHLFVGTAGSGKSSLLLSLFYWLQDALLHPKEEENRIRAMKAFPIFVDLNNFEQDTSKRKHGILQENLMAFLDIQESPIGKEETRKAIDLFKRKTTFDSKSYLDFLVADGYTPFFLFDAVDENSQESIHLLLEIQRFLDKALDKGDRYVAITSRKNAFLPIQEDEDHFFLYDLSRKVGSVSYTAGRIPLVLLEVSEFDERECQLFLSRLKDALAKNKLIGDDEIERKINQIQEKLDNIYSFYKNVNPFFASTMTNISFLERKEEESSSKVMALIADAIFYTFLGRTFPKKMNLLMERDVGFLEVIGFYSVLSQVSDERVDWLHLSDYLNPGLSTQFYDRLSYFKDEKYLLDNQGRFYHEIFAEFFAAAYLYNTLKIANMKNGAYLDLLSLLFNESTFRGDKIPTLLQRFILLFDWEENKDGKSRVDYGQTSLALLLDFLADKDISIYRKALLTLQEELRRNTNAIHIVEDEKGKRVTLTYDGDGLSLFIQKHLPNTFLNHGEGFDYDFFYRIFSAIEDPMLALAPIEFLLSENHPLTIEQIRLPLSALRDTIVNHRWNVDRTIAENLILIHDGLGSDGKTKRYAKWQLSKLLDLFEKARKKSGGLCYRDLLNLSLLAKQPLALSIGEASRGKGFSDIFDLIEFSISPIPVPSSIPYDYPCGEDRCSAFCPFDSILDKRQREHVLSLVTDTDLSREDMECFQSLETLEVHPGKNHPKDIPEELFQKLSRLRNVHLFDGLATIGAFSFYDLNRLEEINIPESVTEIGENAFEDCFLLSHITLPTSHPLSIGPFLFESDASLERINVRNLDGKIHGSLSEGMFLRCKSIENLADLHLQNDLSEIKPFFFAGMRSVGTIDLSSFSNLRRIHRLAFSDIPNLHLILPSGIERIDYLAFAHIDNEDTSRKEKTGMNLAFSPTKEVLCSRTAFMGLSNEREFLAIDSFQDNPEYRLSCSAILVRLMDGTYRLDYLFDKENITSIQDGFFGEGIAISEIHAYLFETMPHLRTFAMHGIRQIGDWLFERCSQLREALFLDSTFRDVPAHMFEKCRNLARVVLPAFDILGESAFEDCYKLESILVLDAEGNPDEMPNVLSCREVGPRAFWNANRIRSLRFLNPCKVHKDAFQGMAKLEDIRFDKGIEVEGLSQEASKEEIREALFDDRDVRIVIGESE